MAVRVDLAERVFHSFPTHLFPPECRICRLSCSAERIDAQDLAEDRFRFCPGLCGRRRCRRRRTDVEQAESGPPGRASGLKRDLPAVVIGERMRHAEQLARGAAVVRRGRRVFAVHSSSTLSCVRLPVRLKSGVGVCSSCRSRCRTCRSRVYPRGELRVKREALEAALAALRLDLRPSSAPLMSRYGVTVLPS